MKISRGTIELKYKDLDGEDTFMYFSLEGTGLAVNVASDLIKKNNEKNLPITIYGVNGSGTKFILLEYL